MYVCVAVLRTSSSTAVLAFRAHEGGDQRALASPETVMAILCK